MQVGEGAFLDALQDSVTDPKCKEEADDKDWTAKVNQWGSGGTCSGTALYGKMDGHKGKYPYFGAPKAFTAKNPPAGGWTKKTISKTRFPIQAHHIIPKNHLPKHPVCTFLGKKYSKHKVYQLKQDAPYSCDHPNNGYCLPYATPLAEWKKAAKAADPGEAKKDLCFYVMEKTGRQLHQGSHRAEAYDAVADDEEASIHGRVPGYLEYINQLLTVVQQAAQTHVAKCEICNPGLKKTPKVKINPREIVATHMDQVSGIVKVLIDANRQFISEPAYLYGHKRARKKLEIPDWLDE
jgi:A nuclease family of the HNH/ENDO VII superfamily with conserved AHH